MAIQPRDADTFAVWERHARTMGAPLPPQQWWPQGPGCNSTQETRAPKEQVTLCMSPAGPCCKRITCIPSASRGRYGVKHTLSSLHVITRLLDDRRTRWWCELEQWAALSALLECEAPRARDTTTISHCVEEHDSPVLPDHVRRQRDLRCLSPVDYRDLAHVAPPSPSHKTECVPHGYNLPGGMWCAGRSPRRRAAVAPRRLPGTSLAVQIAARNATPSLQPATCALPKTSPRPALPTPARSSACMSERRRAAAADACDAGTQGSAAGATFVLRDRQPGAERHATDSWR